MEPKNCIECKKISRVGPGMEVPCVLRLRTLCITEQKRLGKNGSEA